VIEGRSEVGGHPVERRNLRQWVLRITAYAEKLLAGLETVDWPESTKSQQKNWIGRSEGAQVIFELDGRSETLEVFTTRPDTLFGATYMVIAPEHPLVERLTTSANRSKVEAYVEQAGRKSDLDRTELAKKKTGVPTGSYAINPVNGGRIPVWVADYVLMSYGTGAIMAVPAHDERDFAFAKTFQLPIQRVVESDRGTTNGGEEGLPYIGDGFMVHSGAYTGMTTDACKRRITADLEEKSRGRGTINYRLRDWLFSRQRYWGEPFPIVWDDPDAYTRVREAGGAVAVALPEEPVTYRDADGVARFALPIPEGQLPVTLPETEQFRPTGTGESPLAAAADWVEVWMHAATGETVSAEGAGCPGPDWVRGRRETNTMPQWAGSCWYYLRYLDPKNQECLVDPAKERYWGSPDLYMGGAEHAVLHLLYARFWHRFLHEEGHLSEPEPFRKLYHQGVIMGEDGEKMSKSRGNVVNPDDFVRGHGADALRSYLMFMGPLNDAKPWNSQGIQGIFRFLRRVWQAYIAVDGQISPEIVGGREEDAETEKLLHRTIQKVTEDTEALQFNTAISQLMVFSNHLTQRKRFSRETAKIFLQLLAPYAPHLAEELWERLGEKPSVAERGWPDYDPAKLVEDRIRVVVQVNGKVRGELEVPADLPKEEILVLAREPERVQAHLAGKTVRREIVVPNKLVNFVAN